MKKTIIRLWIIISRKIACFLFNHKIKPKWSYKDNFPVAGYGHEDCWGFFTFTLPRNITENLISKWYPKEVSNE
jgi:hypothetical protein